ncbi:hypothetical protein ACFL1K_02540 [Candidatus Omnitrophota bacterium]
MLRKPCVIALLGICMISSAGCAIFGKGRPTESEAILESQILVKFPDIPVPAGFKLVPQDSYSFEGAGVRVGMLKYRGRADANQVVNFFKDQMVMYDWRFLNTVEYGQRILNFDREDETCVINIIPRGRSVDIVFALGPKSRISLRKADKKIE